MKLRFKKPGQVLREPFPHQVRCLRRAQELECPAFLMEMRTGKTFTSIRWVLSLPREEARTIVVICPATVVLVWKRELAMEGEHYVLLQGGTELSKYERIRRAQQSKSRIWLIISFDSLVSMSPVVKVQIRGKIRRKREIPLFAQLPWDVVIIDESRRIANPRNFASQICVDGFANTQHRAILTGMMNPESYLEVFQQMKFLHGHFLGYTKYWRFRNSLFQVGFDGHKMHPKYGTKALIKKAVHDNAVVCTAAQAGMPTLPFYEPRYLKLSPKQKTLYRQVEKEFAIQLQHPDPLTQRDWGRHPTANNWVLETNYVLTMKLWLRYLTGGFDPAKNLVSSAKADEIVDLLRTDLKDKQVVIWYAMRHELRYMENRLTKAGITHASVLGGMPLADKEQALDKAHSGFAQVFQATEETAKYGLDCAFTDTAIYYSNSWSGEARGQSERRIFHPSKPGPRLIIDLIYNDTWEVDQYDTIREKVRESRSFMREVDHRFLQRVMEMSKSSRSRKSA